MNKYPLWKYVLVLVVIILAALYALPNVYGENPAVQISPPTGQKLAPATVSTVNDALKTAGLTTLGEMQQEQTLLLRFSDSDTQAKAKDLIQKTLGKSYTVAFNLASASPHWLSMIGAYPMKLGLDLRGGMHFLLQVDMASVIDHRVQGEMRTVLDTFRKAHIRYTGFNRVGKNGITIDFRDLDSLKAGLALLNNQFSDFAWQQQSINAQHYRLSGMLSTLALQEINENIMQQAIQTLQRRVNELGVSEPIVQQQGIDRIAVDLPGVQDAARAQNIIGNTATLEFHLVDSTHDAQNAVQGVVPVGSELLYTRDGNRPVLLQSPIILKGSAITSAYADIGQDGRPEVVVRLGGGGDEAHFARATAENVGKLMGVVYVETQSHIKTEGGQTHITYQKVRDIINIATIEQPLGNSFQVTGLPNLDEANNLALLLRAGSLPTTVTIVEEQTVGPSLGQANINKGIVSVVAGLVIIIVFMLIYYRFFGLIADIGLVINLIFVVAVMSLLGAVLTLPGIAGMVLTVGMAVDANVLINERIREELRQGLSIASSIQAGYDRALATIIDSNVTTLIAALVLLSVGSGAVKGFAVTLTIGILTSMFTAIIVTRSIVNLIYGGAKVKSISIGIRLDRLSRDRAKNEG